MWFWKFKLNWHTCN